MVKTFKILSLQNQKTDILETCYTASGSQVYYQICSNDNTGLTFTIFFLTWPNFFPNASAWVKKFI